MTRRGYDDMGSTGHHKQAHGETGRKRSLEIVSMFLWYHLCDGMVENCMDNYVEGIPRNEYFNNNPVSHPTIKVLLS